jgi:DNA-binding MarR family transcriptional regulator
MPDELSRSDNAIEVAREILAVLPLLTRIVAAEVHREAGDDTTMPQFRVLAHLHEAPLTVSDLARRRRVTLQSMGELVQVLVERGWIIRTPDPDDRRRQLLELTDDGHRHYERAHAAVLDRLSPLLAHLTPRETRAVRLAMPALRRVLAGEVESTSDGNVTPGQPRKEGRR